MLLNQHCFGTRKLASSLEGKRLYYNRDHFQNICGYEKTSDSALERTIAKKLNGLPKYVISRMKVDLIWRNSQQIVINDRETLVREIQNLEKTSRSISVESGVKTWQLFIQNDLFDDLWLFVHPVVVSRGERLFTYAE